MSRAIKWSLQWRGPNDTAATWKDCHNGHPTILGYTAAQDDLLIRDFQRLKQAYPHNQYRIVQHVDFVEPVAAAIKPR